MGHSQGELIDTDLEHLRTKNSLLQLLMHYARLAAPERTAWQDRLMVMDGVDAPNLSKLHGALIAFGLVDQNTGNTPILRVGAVPACYRITLAGLRAVQQIPAPDNLVKVEESSPPKKYKRKRAKSNAPELVTTLS